MCCGYPNYLDEDGYKNANPETYFRLAEQLDNSMIQQVSIKDAHRHNDLTLLDHFTKTSIILGSIGNINTLFSLFHQEKKEIREAVQP